MNTTLCLKINLDIDFQITIAWKAIKRFLHMACEYAKDTLS